MLRFKKSNKFYCVQAAKIVNQKHVKCQRIKFCPWWPIFTRFSIFDFLAKNAQIQGNQSTNWYRIGSYLKYFQLIWLDWICFVSFPLWLFGHIFSQNKLVINDFNFSIVNFLTLVIRIYSKMGELWVHTAYDH